MGRRQVGSTHFQWYSWKQTRRVSYIFIIILTIPHVCFACGPLLHATLLSPCPPSFFTLNSSLALCLFILFCVPWRLTGPSVSEPFHWSLWSSAQDVQIRRVVPVSSPVCYNPLCTVVDGSGSVWARSRLLWELTYHNSSGKVGNVFSQSFNLSPSSYVCPPLLPQHSPSLRVGGIL